MDAAKGMLLSQIYPMKLINVSASSRHVHTISFSEPTKIGSLKTDLLNGPLDLESAGQV